MRNSVPHYQIMEPHGQARGTFRYAWGGIPHEAALETGLGFFTNIPLDIIME
jgi:hypothetical protein